MNEGGLILTPSVDILPDENRVIIKTQYHQKDLAKAVPGSRYDRANQRWTAPLSWGTVWALRAIFGDRVTISEGLLDWIHKYHDLYIKEILEIRDRWETTLGFDWEDPLFGYQRVGVEFLVAAQRALLADEMGTGKTVQSISAIRAVNEYHQHAVDEGQEAKAVHAFPVLVVCPNSMKKTWAKEFEQWYPGTRVEVVQGSAMKRRASIQKIDNREADVLVINWEALKSHTRLAPYGSVALRKCKDCGGDAATASCEYHSKELNDIRWGAVIADEAHRAKNAKAKQTRALWWVAHQQDCYRFALTGTPIANHPGDLWSILHFIAPEDWPSKVKYTDLYCLVGWNPWGGHDILDLDPRTRDIFNSVFHPRFLRRPKDAVLRDLPPKVYQTRFVEMTPKQRKAYTQLEANFIAELEAGIGFTTNPMTQMMRLLQLASSHAEVDADNNWRLAAPSSKVDEVLDIVEAAGDESVVVFAESRQLISLLEQALSKEDIPYVSVHGEVSTDDRQIAVDRFQKKEVNVILLTLGAGGEGITLTEADVMVFMQRSWSMVKNRQAEDRVHRIGLSRPVTIIDLIAPDTVEEHRMEVLTDKDAKLENLVQDQQTIKRLLGVA